MARQQVDQFMNAIAGIESGGASDPWTVENPRTAAHGKWQIMPDNWSPWAQEAGIGQDAPRTPENQRRVARHKMLEYYDQFGAWDAVAVAWFAGPGRARRYQQGDTSVLSLDDGHTTVREYVQRVNQNMPVAGQGEQAATPEFGEGGELQGAGPVPSPQRAGVDSRQLWRGILQSMSDRMRGGDGSRGEDIVRGAREQAGEAEQMFSRTELDVDGDVGVRETLQRLYARYGNQGAIPDWDLTGVPADQVESVVPGARSLPQGRRPDPQRDGGGGAGQEVVDIASQYLGVPYKWGGTNPEKGLDCSGFIQLVYKQMGIDIPRVSYQQARAGRQVSGGIENAQPGDILAFASRGQWVGHVGIYIGNGQMMHAPRRNTNVRIDDISDHWMNNLQTIRRFVPDGTPAGGSGGGGGGAVVQPV